MPVVLEKVLQHIRENQLRLGFEPSTAAQLDALIDDCWDYVYARNPRAAVSGALNGELGTEHLLRLEAALHMERWKQNFELNDPQPGEGEGGGSSVVTPTGWTPVWNAQFVAGGAFSGLSRVQLDGIWFTSISDQGVENGDIGYIEVHRVGGPPASDQVLRIDSIDHGVTGGAGDAGTIVLRDGMNGGDWSDLRYGPTAAAVAPGSPLDGDILTTGWLVDHRGAGVDVYMIYPSGGSTVVVHHHLTDNGAEITEMVRFAIGGEGGGVINDAGNPDNNLYDLNTGNTAGDRALWGYDVVGLMIAAGFGSVVSGLSNADLAWKVTAVP
jgi:hypothetical protein